VSLNVKSFRAGLPNPWPAGHTWWPAILSGVARVEIEAVKKLHEGNNFDAITKLNRTYFGCKQG